MAEAYAGPSLSISFEAIEPGTSRWELTITAPDHSGSRELAYRARGTQGSLTFDLAVRDASRPVWTTMPPNHRQDLRGLVSELVAASFKIAALAEKST